MTRSEILHRFSKNVDMRMQESMETSQKCLELLLSNKQISWSILLPLNLQWEKKLTQQDTDVEVVPPRFIAS